MMFIGSKTSEILESKEGHSLKEFLSLARKAFKAAGVGLQKKMPFNNKTLKMINGLDPEARTSPTAQTYLEYEKDLSVLVPKDCKDAFVKEVKKYTTSPSLSALDTSVPIDVFLGTLMNENEYPNLVKFAKTLLSGFHGPLVEASFSAMRELMDKKVGAWILTLMQPFRQCDHLCLPPAKIPLRLSPRKIQPMIRLMTPW